MTHETDRACKAGLRCRRLAGCNGHLDGGCWWSLRLLRSLRGRRLLAAD